MKATPSTDVMRAEYRDDHVATIYQTPAWRRLMALTSGFGDATRDYRFADGCRGVLPLCELPRRFRLFRNLFSMPAGYGGLVGPDLYNHPHHATEIAAGLKNVVRRGGTVHLVGNPFLALQGGTDPLQEAIQSKALGLSFHRFSTFTHLLPLDEDYQRLWTGAFDQKARNQYRKGVRSGVVVQAGPGVAQLPVFYDIYRASARRWGLSSPPDSMAFYEHLLSLDSNGLVWVARDKEGAAVSAAVCLYHGTHAYLWASALHKEYAFLRPNDVLYAEMIQDACNRGYKVFDFGSSDGLPNVQAFKEQFGSIRVDVPHAILGHPLAIALRRWRPAVLRPQPSRDVSNRP